IQHQAELEKLQRTLQLQARSGGKDAALTPVERLYVEALRLSASAPDSAAGMLRSLVDLYGPGGSNQAESSAAAVVQLANRRLAALEEELAKQHERELASLRERLDTAGQVAATHPQQAAAM